jgi:hypothetical protein
MTYIYIGLAVLAMGWFVWVTCKVMAVMGRDPPAPAPVSAMAETILCMRCGRPIPEPELASHSCGSDDTQ